MRLTKNIKEMIYENALDSSGYTEEMKAYTKKLENFAEKVRIAAFGGPKKLKEAEENIEKIKSLAEKLPKDLIYMCGNSRSIAAVFGGQRRTIEYGDERRLCSPSISVTGDHPLALEVAELDKEVQLIEEKKSNILQAVWPLLNSVNTSAKLLLIWPEAAELIPAATKPKTQLPAVKIEELNGLVRLPSQK